MMKYRLSILRGACAVLVMAGSGLAVAQEATQRPADKNGDNIVSRQEYMDHMTMTWGEQHAKMMKADKNMRADSMSNEQFKGIWVPAGNLNADTNSDNMVSRQEYMDYMGKSWEENHGRMMKADKNMKADGMSREQFDSIWFPDGRLKPGKVGG